MRKIKVLHKVFLIINILIIIGMIFTICLYYGIIPEGEVPTNGAKPDQFKFITINLFSLLLLFGMYSIQKCFYYMYTISYFNSTSIKNLKIGGYTLIAYSITSKIIYFFQFNEELMTYDMKFELGIIEFLTTLITIMTGIGCLIFADTLSKGNELKEVNDLTI
jgi:hypothetical protein